MGVLDKEKNAREKAERKQSRRTPHYKKDGTVKKRWKLIPLTVCFLILLIGLCIAAIHIPTLIYKEPVIAKENRMVMNANEAGLKNMLDYVKDHPNADFDSDGLTNAEETNYGTDPRLPDTDMDGISDYAEIYVYNTRPCEAENNLDKIVKQMLDERGLKETIPYKLHDVIMWADDIRSRSAGTVVPTLRGYRFSKFNGWAQFPGEVYAYRIVNGIHEPLEYREYENAWRINSYTEDEEVVLYQQKLPTTHLLTLFDRKYYVDDGLISTILGYTLPKEHSFITYKEIVWQDTYTEELQATVTGTEMPAYDATDMTRFETTTTEFGSLTDAYSSILAGKPVIVSLQSSSYGETICLAYGYTELGDLLIADEYGNTTDQNGNTMLLDIIERSAITIDQNGGMRQREFFDFYGLGYDSTKGDKIHFIYVK